MNNCIAYDTVVLNQIGFLSLAIDSSENISCNGTNDGFISVTASNGVLPYSYSWSNGDTIEDLLNLGPNTYSLTVTDGAGCTQTISQTITEPLVLTHSVTHSDVNCFNAADGQINLAVSGGTQPYSYSWAHNPSLSSASASALAPGTYVYTIIDDKLCEIIDSVAITEPSVLTGSAAGVDLQCGGDSSGSISFSALGGTTPYSYSINSGGSFSSSSVFNSLPAGTYYTQLKDANNCTLYDTIVLSEPPVLSISLDSLSNVSCNGLNNGYIAISVNGGLGNYSYSWSNGDTLEDALALTANSYSVTVTDSTGCSVIANYNISEPSSLGVATVTTNITCNGASDGVISIPGTGGQPPYSYSWAHNSSLTTSTASSLDTGNYNYTVTDFNGCSVSGLAMIAQPDSLIVQSVNINKANCSNGADASLKFNVVGGMLPFNFTITDATSGNVIANSDSVGNLVPGVYNFTVTDTNNCSASMLGVAVGFEHAPIKPFISAQDSSVCFGSTTTLSLNQGIFSALWNDGQSGLSRNLPFGSYWVSSTDTNGCSALSDTLVIDSLYAHDTTAQICLVTYDPILGKNRIVFDKPNDEVGIATYNVFKDVFGVWQNIGSVNAGDSSQFVDATSQPNSKVARYYLETEDGCGTSFPASNHSIHKTILLQSSIGSNNEVNLSWNHYEGANVWYYRILRKPAGSSFVAIDSVGSAFNTYIDNSPPFGNTSYFIEAVLFNSCTIKQKTNSTFNSILTNLVTENTIGIPENIASQFSIYPNPATEVLNIESFGNIEQKQFQLFDSKGKLIIELNTKEEMITLDISNIPKGVYQLKVQLEKAVFVTSIVKE